MSATIYSTNFLRDSDLLYDLLCDGAVPNSFIEYGKKCLRAIYKYDARSAWGAVIKGMEINHINFRGYGNVKRYGNEIVIHTTHDANTICVNVAKLLHTPRLLYIHSNTPHGDDRSKGSDNNDWREHKSAVMQDRGLFVKVMGEKKGWATFNDNNCYCTIDHSGVFYDGRRGSSNADQCFKISVTRPTYPKCEVNFYEINFQSYRICVEKGFHGCQVVKFYKLHIYGYPIEDYHDTSIILLSIVSKSILYRDNIYVKSYKYTSHDDSRVGYVLKYCHKDNIDYEHMCILDLCYGPIEEKYINYTQRTVFNEKDISPNSEVIVFEGDICSRITGLDIKYHIPHNLFVVYPERTLPDLTNIICNGTNHNLDYETIHRLHVMMKSEYISVKGLYKHLDANGVFHTSLQECMRIQVYHKGSQVNDIFMSPDNELKDYDIHFFPRHDDMDSYFNQIVVHKESGQNRFSVESVIDSATRLAFDTHTKEMMDDDKEKKCSKEKLCVSEAEYIINSCTEKMKFILLYAIKIGNLDNIDDYKNNQYYCLEGSIDIFSQLRNDLYIEDYV